MNKIKLDNKKIYIIAGAIIVIILAGYFIYTALTREPVLPIDENLIINPEDIIDPALLDPNINIGDEMLPPVTEDPLFPVQ